MKKVLSTTLAMFVLVSFGSVFAQSDEVAHDVTITIPDVAFLRFTATTAIADVTAVTPDDVEFLLDAADVAAGTPIAPSNGATANWGDLKVFVNYSSNWEVTVSVAETSTATFDWSKVGVGAWDVDGGTAGSGSSSGWTSLGFGAADFRLTLDGSEIAETYTATVTYTLVAP